jgi:hypothetical protein
MMNIIRVQLPATAANQNGGTRGAAKPSAAASVEGSPAALEVADRVVAPEGEGKTAEPAPAAHHH